MPANAAAAAATDAYRAQLLLLRQQVAAAASTRWSSVSLAELDRSYAAWLAQTVPAVAAAQRSSAVLATAYLSAYLSRSIERPVPPERVDLQAILAAGTGGRTIAAALAPPLYTVKAALRTVAGSRALEVALGRALRTIGETVTETAGEALRAAMIRSSIVPAWRRIVSANCCGACLALAGREYETRKAVERHPGCRCTAEPVVAGVVETVKREKGYEIVKAMTPDQLAATFAGRGGADKARLLLDGEISLDDLVTRTERADGGAWISETPLATLAA